MKKSPASIEENANASAKQARADSAKATGNIFHSKLPATENHKEKSTMKTTTTTARKPRAVRQYEAIEAHGKNLLAIFPNACERDPVALCKKLRRLEAKASRITTDYCNGDFDAGENGEKLDAALDAILAKVNAILGNNPEDLLRAVPVFVNGDPRGYALKIDDVWMHNKQPRLCRDWGGYGILAPEITGD